MVNISLPRDNNRIAVIGGTSSSDGITPTTIYVDPTTHRVLVDNASGTGDVVGPASAVDSNFASFNTTTGKLIKDSGYSPSSFVPYIGGTTNVDLGLHNLTVDTNTLFIDSVYHRVGIGTLTPNIIGVNNNNRILDLRCSNAGYNAQLQFGTIGTASATADTLGQISFYGMNGGSSAVAIARIESILDGAINSTKMNFTVMNAGVSSTALMIKANGNVGVGTTAPTAVLQLKAGTATLNTAPLKFTSGINLTTAEAGAMEYDGTNLYFTPTGTTRKTFAYTTDATTTPTASKIVQRDANGNIFFNNYFANSASTVSAGGTTVLTVASARYQALTGSLSQTFQLPDATTLAISSIFTLNNNSSGTLVIKNNGGTTIYTIPAGGYVQAEPIDISTANGTWEILPYAPSTVTWGSGTAGLIMNSVLSTTPTIGAGASSATVPVFIPQRGASTTGFGGDGTNLHAIIGGATSTTFNSTGLSVGTSGVVTTGTIELGHATDTTLSRVSAGVLAVEGVVIPSISSTNTFTNKRINPRLVTTTSYTTDTGTSLDVSTCDQFEITAQAGALLFNAPSGTPLGGQKLIIRIKDNGTARALTYNAIFRAMGNALPSTTVLSKTLYMGFIYNFTDSKWDLVAVAQES